MWTRATKPPSAHCPGKVDGRLLDFFSPTGAHSTAELISLRKILWAAPDSAAFLKPWRQAIVTSAPKWKTPRHGSPKRWQKWSRVQADEERSIRAWRRIRPSPSSTYLIRITEDLAVRRNSRIPRQ